MKKAHMKKICFLAGVLSIFALGCTGKGTSSGEGTNGTCPPSDSCIEPESCPQADECPLPETGCLDGQLSAEQSDITLYYDYPKTLNVHYAGGHKSGVVLNVEGNNCLDISKTSVTDSNGDAKLTLKAKLFGCDEGRKVKICLAQNALNCAQDGSACKSVCTEVTVRTIKDEEICDSNHNLMLDEYETSNEYKEKYSGYVPGDCSSFCHSDSDCGPNGFCDSAIGSVCSTRCTSDDQCIKYLDEDGNWKQMMCRADGRCAYREFKYLYKIAGKSDKGTTVTLGGYPVDDSVTIDWGDGTVEKVDKSTRNNLSHTYPQSKSEKRYLVTITGDYRDWTAGCSVYDGIDLHNVEQFGPIGLGYGVDNEHGSFTGCRDFTKITAKDIPDASKMTHMDSMFAGVDFKNTENAAVGMKFNAPAVTRWDTSNVTSMYRVFFNNGDGDINGYPGFNQEIGRWNTSKVTNMADLFFAAVKFNGDITCWDTSQVTDISNLFRHAEKFNQDLSNWNLDNVTQHECVFRAENGHNGDISLNNYCKIRSLLPGEDNDEVAKEMGREGTKRGTKCIEKEFYDGKEFYTGSTCCGVENMSEEAAKASICEGGIDVGVTCQNPAKKDRIIQRCLDEYIHKQDFWDTGEPKAYKDMQPDDITCAHLRRCRDCPGLCNRCLSKCRANGSCEGVAGCEKLTIEDGRRLISWVWKIDKVTGKEKRVSIETTCSCDHLLQ